MDDDEVKLYTIREWIDKDLRFFAPVKKTSSDKDIVDDLKTSSNKKDYGKFCEKLDDFLGI